MSRTPKPYRQVYAVVRYDAYLTDVADGLDRYVVKEIVHDLATARREVERLNKLQPDTGQVYGWQSTHLYPPGTAAGALGEE